MLLERFVFQEHSDRRIFLGMVVIVTGGVPLSPTWGGALALPLGTRSVIGTCLCWGSDDSLTQKVSAGDPVQVTAIE